MLGGYRVEGNERYCNQESKPQQSKLSGKNVVSKCASKYMGKGEHMHCLVNELVISACAD